MVVDNTEENYKELQEKMKKQEEDDRAVHPDNNASSARPPLNKGDLLIVVAPHFAAGILYKEKAAEIIGYMSSWDLRRIKWYCQKKKWTVRTYAEQVAYEKEKV